MRNSADVAVLMLSKAVRATLRNQTAKFCGVAYLNSYKDSPSPYVLNFAVSSVVRLQMASPILI